MAKYFKYTYPSRGGSFDWTDQTPSSTLLNNEFFSISTEISTLTGEIIIEGFSPQVINPVNINSLTGSIEVEGFNPILVISNNTTVRPFTGEIVLQSYIPSVVTTSTPIKIKIKAGDYEYSIPFRQIIKEDEEILAIIQTFIQCLK